MNTAHAHLAAVPCASTISTMPAAIAIGKVAAWIHPRQVGRISDRGIELGGLDERELRHLRAFVGELVRSLVGTRVSGHAPSLRAAVCPRGARAEGVTGSVGV